MKHFHLILIFFIVLLASCRSSYLTIRGHSTVITTDTLTIDRGSSYSH